MTARGEHREPYWGIVCERCERGFSADSWDGRHSDFDGEDIHAECCEEFGPCHEVDGWERLTHLRWSY